MRVRPLALACLVAACLVSHVRSAQNPVGPGVTKPSVLFEQKPAYTENALRAKVQGIVEVEAEIKEDGTVGNVRIHKSLDKVFGLDLEALKAARGWRFKPATKDGKPVPFVVIIQLEFRLSPNPRTGIEDFGGGALREDAPGLIAPKAKSPARPNYTAEALRNKVEGDVLVEIVVSADGTVERARIARSLDKQYGLDEQAMFAAGRMTFEPGSLNGGPVAVLITVPMTFKIR